VENEEKNVETFAHNLSSHLVAYIPRNELFRECEFNGKTVIEAAPDSPLAQTLRQLKDTIIENTQLTIPTPLTLESLETMAIEWYQKSSVKRRR